MKIYSLYLFYAPVFFIGIVFCSHLALKGNAVNLFASLSKRNVHSAQEAISIFPHSVEEVVKQVDATLARLQEDVVAVIAIHSKERTYKNTVDAISELRAPVRELSGILETVGFVYVQKEMREEALTQKTRINSALKEAVDFNKDLYDAVADYVAHNLSSESLNDAQKYFLEMVLNDFKRGGVDKSDADRAKIKQVNKEILNVVDAFSAAIANANASITAVESDLTGISQDFIGALKKNDAGECIIPCDYPSADEVMSHCSNPDVRKRFLHAFTNRGYPENRENLIKLSALRHQFSQLQGYKNFAEYELATSTMAKRVDTVEKFMAGLAPLAKEKLEKEIAQLLSDKPVGVTSTDKLEPWDSAYLSAYHLEKYYNIDDRKVAEYFPMESTIKGLFSIYETFLGLKFVERPAQGAWHEDVRLMEVQKDGIVRGYIFLDLFPRPFKYTHACFVPTIPAQRYVDEKGKETIRPMVGTIICNFSKPTADKPSLLKYDSEAVIFFHEFGHALHDVMGATSTAETAGCAQVKIDFVEMPSQMFEEWLADKDMLKKVTKHYQTGESMPDEMIDKLLSLVVFDSGAFISRQLKYSEFSLHSFSGPLTDPDALDKELFDKYLSVQCRFASENKAYANFGHLTEYSCRYYGYLWSRVFSLDLAEYVRERGLLNIEVGKAFGENVLGAGASQDPDVLLEDFLGRKPRQDAFLKAYGLKK